MKKKGSSKKDIKTQEEKPAVTPETKISEAKPSPLFLRVIVGVAIVALIAAVFFAVDSETGWGDSEKVVKKQMARAEKLAIHKKFDEASVIYSRIVSRWGGDEKVREIVKQARLSLAQAYKDSGNYIRAIELYRELIEENRGVNGDMYAWLNLELADSLNYILSTDEAIRVYEKIISEFDGTDWAAEAMMGIADAYMSKKDYVKAVKYYDRINEKYKKSFLSAEAMTGKARIYEAQGREKQAIALYKKISEEFPDIVTEYARSRISVLVPAPEK